MISPRRCCSSWDWRMEAFLEQPREERKKVCLLACLRKILLLLFPQASAPTFSPLVVRWGHSDMGNMDPEWTVSACWCGTPALGWVGHGLCVLRPVSALHASCLWLAQGPVQQPGPPGLRCTVVGTAAVLVASTTAPGLSGRPATVTSSKKSWTPCLSLLSVYK